MKLNKEGPKLTAGLNTPPEIFPTAKAPAVTVKQLQVHKTDCLSNFYLVQR